MSAPPSIPPVGPTLAEVLVRRAFTRPPQVFVDGDLIKALGHADDGEHAVAPIESTPTPADQPTGKRVDVRV